MEEPLVHADTRKRLQVLFDERTFSGLTDGALLDRLARRGLGLPAGLLTAGLTASATEAAVPATLADSLVRAVFSIATERNQIAGEKYPQPPCQGCEGRGRISVGGG